MSSRGVPALASMVPSRLRASRAAVAPARLLATRGFAASGARHGSSSPPPRSAQRRDTQDPQQQKQHARKDEGEVSGYTNVALSCLRPLLQPAGTVEADGAPGEVPLLAVPPTQVITAADIASLLFGGPFIMKGPIRPDRLETRISSAPDDDGKNWSDRPLGPRYRDPYFTVQDAAGVVVPVSRAEVDNLVAEFFERAKVALVEPPLTRTWTRRARFNAKKFSAQHRIPCSVVDAPFAPRVQHITLDTPTAAEPLMARAGPKSSDIKWRKIMMKKHKRRRQRKARLRARAAAGEIINKPKK